MDGKPFKTREGGVMRLEMLMKNINEKMYEKITENHTVDPNEAEKTAKIVALSAIKYGDLSNQASKDYIFVLIVSLLLKEIQDHIFYIPSCVSSRS